MGIQTAVSTIGQNTFSGGKMGAKISFFVCSAFGYKMYQDDHPYNAWEVMHNFTILMSIIPICTLAGFTLGVIDSLFEAYVELLAVESNELTLIPR